MRIGHYVSVVSGQRGFERNVSGHIQIPLQAMKLLRDAGHEVELITNRFGPERTLPACMPEGVPIHLVEDARRRGGILERTGAEKKGVRPLKLIRQMMQVKRIVKARGFDVLHAYGHARTAEFAGALRMTGLRTPVVATLVQANVQATPGMLKKRLWVQLGAVVVGTDYGRRVCEEAGISARVVRHGVVRDLQSEVRQEAVGPRRRVLFWRDATVHNGADVCLEAYDTLAPRFPDVSFDLAIRPNWEEVEGIDDLPRRHANVHVYRFPYQPGISLAKLVAESICILLPFRSLTIDPQFAILESLAAGVPVVTTTVRANPELITSGCNGMLVPPGDAAATIEALQQLLGDREGSAEMGRRAAAEVASRWNWDDYADELLRIYQEVR